MVHSRLVSGVRGWVVAGFAALAGPSILAAPPEGHPWLGIFLGDALDGGVQVVSLLPDGPASRAGLLEGDVVLAVGEKETANRIALGEAVEAFRPGQVVPVRVLRGGSVRVVDVTAGRFPSAAPLPPPPAGALSVAGDVLGLDVREVSADLRAHFGAPRETGLLVAAVRDGSAASEAGVRVGDVLVRASGRPLVRSIDLVLAVRVGEGRSVVFDVVRGGKPVEVRVPVRLRPGGVGRSARDEEVENLRREVEALRRELDEARAMGGRDGV